MRRLATIILLFCMAATVSLAQRDSKEIKGKRTREVNNNTICQNPSAPIENKPEWLKNISKDEKRIYLTADTALVVTYDKDYPYRCWVSIRYTEEGTDFSKISIDMMMTTKYCGKEFQENGKTYHIGDSYRQFAIYKRKGPVLKWKGEVVVAGVGNYFILTDKVWVAKVEVAHNINEKGQNSLRPKFRLVQKKLNRKYKRILRDYGVVKDKDYYKNLQEAKR